MLVFKSPDAVTLTICLLFKLSYRLANLRLYWQAVDAVLKSCHRYGTNDCIRRVSIYVFLCYISMSLCIVRYVCCICLSVCFSTFFYTSVDTTAPSCVCMSLGRFCMSSVMSDFPCLYNVAVLSCLYMPLSYLSAHFFAHFFVYASVCLLLVATHAKHLYVLTPFFRNLSYFCSMCPYTSLRVHVSLCFVVFSANLCLALDVYSSVPGYISVHHRVLHVAPEETFSSHTTYHDVLGIQPASGNTDRSP